MKTLGLIILSITLFSCKTQEQIKKEQMIDNMAVQMTQNQKLLADSLNKIQDFEENMGQLNGQLDEVGNKNQTMLKLQVEELEKRLSFIEENAKNQQKEITSLQAKIKEQSDYIQSVLKALKDLKSPPKKKTRASSKKQSQYDRAISMYKKSYYTKSRPIFLELLKNKNIKGNKRARVLHNLGMIAVIKKENQNAMGYFGKLFTEFPKSNYNANGLYQLGKVLKKEKQIDSAKQTFTELTKRFPKSKYSKLAATELQGL